MKFFGLDIGSQNLKIAQIEKNGKEANLLAFGSFPAPPRGLLSESEADLTALAEAIKKLQQEAQVKTKNVATALPQDKVYTKLVTFPKLSEKELKSAIKWEAEQYVPIPLDEATIDYQVIDEVKEGKKIKTEVLLVAAPKRMIEKLIRVLRAADLNPVSLETEIFALARSLVSPDSESVLLVDLGARATDMAVVEGSQLVFTRSVPTAGEAFTRAVASNLNLDPAQAEEYKKAYGIDPKKLEGKISDVLQPLLESLVNEMEKVIRFYQSSKKKRIKKVILAGGTAILPEISFEVQMGNPFARLKKNDEMMAKIPKGLAPLYATAIGLALKKIG